MIVYGYDVAFVSHIVVEIPAFAMFMIYPSRQLNHYTPTAHAVIRQYALLLLSSIIISATFAVRPHSELSCYVALALAIYHVGPTLRALSYVVEGLDSSKRHPKFAEHCLYAIVHILCGSMLLFTALGLL